MSLEGDRRPFESDHGGIRRTVIVGGHPSIQRARWPTPALALGRTAIVLLAVCRAA